MINNLRLKFLSTDELSDKDKLTMLRDRLSVNRFKAFSDVTINEIRMALFQDLPGSAAVKQFPQEIVKLVHLLLGSRTENATRCVIQVLKVISSLFSVGYCSRARFMLYGTVVSGTSLIGIFCKEFHVLPSF